jgi:hypothetical protein
LAFCCSRDNHRYVKKKLNSFTETREEEAATSRYLKEKIREQKNAVLASKPIRSKAMSKQTLRVLTYLTYISNVCNVGVS